MKNIIKEHEIVNQDYSSPFLFIKDYIFMYNKQANVPYKVFFEDIKYSKIYETSLFACLIEPCKGKSYSDNFKEIEALLEYLQKQPFYDKIFLENTKAIYYKSIAIVLDRVILEIERLDFKNIEILYLYNLDKLDLYNILVDNILKNIRIDTKKLEIDILSSFWFYLVKCIDDLDYINLQLKDIKRHNLEEIKKRINMPKNFIGTYTILVYTKQGLLECILQRLILIISFLKNDKKYIVLSNLISEMVLREICDESELSEYFKYKNNLLIEK